MRAAFELFRIALFCVLLCASMLSPMVSFFYGMWTGDGLFVAMLYPLMLIGWMILPAILCGVMLPKSN